MCALSARRISGILDCLRCKRSSCEQSIGVSVKAETVDTNIMAHIIQPNCLNSTPDIPVTIVSGKNTAIIVSVEATTEIATSFVP